MKTINPLRRRVCAAAVAALAWAALQTPARAHDTWFQQLSAPGAAPVLALGTGHDFGRFETGVGTQYLQQPGCATADGAAALTPVRNAARSLVLRTAAGAQSCWLQLTPFDTELSPAKVALYLNDINASASLRATWAAMQARGVRWQERYTKHARIELQPGGASTPAPLGLDATLQRQGATWLFTVLRDGQPLPGQAVELRSASPAAGTWHHTDAQGQVRVPALPAGRWLLRSIDLRLDSADANRWDSRFLTLAFEGGAGTAAAAAR